MDLKTKRATTPLITLNKRSRKPVAKIVLESRNEYISERLIPDLERFNLTHKVKRMTLEEDSKPLVEDNTRQLEIGGINEIASSAESAAAKVSVDPRNRLNELTAGDGLCMGPKRTWSFASRCPDRATTSSAVFFLRCGTINSVLHQT